MKISRFKTLCAALLALAAAVSMSSAVAPAQPAGGIMWLEIRAVNLARAQAFYSGMFGWSFQSLSPIASLFTAPNIEGMINQEPGHQAGFTSMTGYFRVAAVQKSCDKAVQLGGSIAVTPRVLPGKGSFCVVQDSEGNRLGLISDEPRP